MLISITLLIGKKKTSISSSFFSNFFFLFFFFFALLFFHFLGCYFNVIVQGAPPFNIANWLLIIYAVVLGLSWAGLFLSLWFTMKNQQRMTYFNMYSVDQIYYCGKKHRTFEDYFDCHCKWLDWISSALFYSGTFFLVVSAGVLVGSVFYWSYDNWISTVIYGVVCTLILLVLIFILSFLPVATRKKLGPDSERFMAEFNARIRGQISTQDPALKPVFHSHSTTTDHSNQSNQTSNDQQHQNIAPFARNFLLNSTYTTTTNGDLSQQQQQQQQQQRRSQLLRASAANQEENLSSLSQKKKKKKKNGMKDENNVNNSTSSENNPNSRHPYQSALKNSDTPTKSNNVQQQVNFASSPPKFRNRSNVNESKQSKERNFAEDENEEEEEGEEETEEEIEEEEEEELSDILNNSQDTQQQVGDLGSDRDLLNSSLGSEDDFLNSEFNSFDEFNPDRVEKNAENENETENEQQNETNQETEEESCESEAEKNDDDDDDDDNDDDDDDHEEEDDDDGLSEEELDRQLEILRKETRREMKEMTSGPPSASMKHDDDNDNDEEE